MKRSSVGKTNGIPVRHRWVFEVLHRAGCSVGDGETGVYSVQLSPGLVDMMGREEVRIAFQRRLAARDGVELASPGSWFHDQLVRYTRERGRYTVSYLRPGAEAQPEPILNRRRRGTVTPLSLMEKRYGVLFLFSFRISFYSEPAREDLWHLTFDCERGRVLKRPLPKRVLENGGEEGEEGFGPPPKADVRKAFRTVWEDVQDEVENSVHAIRQEGKDKLEENLLTVERYYRQLIQEEKRLLKTRSNRRAQEETRHKIDLLKLEWERRVKEESERLEPQVVVSLAAVARVLAPLERWRCRVEGRGGPVQRDIWVDLARGEAWGTPARRKGTR
jgi:hypothetical protein